MSINLKNRTIYCNDNLNILRGINNECIDLIYLDPPFNSGRNYGGARQSMAELAQFKDTWDEDDENIEWWFSIKEKHPRLYSYLKDVDDYASKSTQVYLTMMAVRMLEMHRVLKPTGSLYYHCDQTAGHYVKVMLDIIFGMGNFRNEIVWLYEGRELSKKMYNKKHDTIFYYTKSNKWVFNWEEIGNSLKESSRKAMSRFVDEKGIAYVLRYKQGGGFAPKEKEGTPEVYRQDVPEKIPPRDWVHMDYERKSKRSNYPTQKPLALLERIVKASSNEGDMVLDPFCGCATTCVAAEKLERQWVGIDVWEDAHNIIQKRLLKDFDLWEGGRIHHLTRPPIRTDADPKNPPTRTRKYIPDEIKEQVWERDEGGCRNCGAKENLQYDHVIPYSKGGNDEVGNLQILCRSCNLKKSDTYHS